MRMWVWVTPVKVPPCVTYLIQCDMLGSRLIFSHMRYVRFRLTVRLASLYNDQPNVLDLAARLLYFTLLVDGGTKTSDMNYFTMVVRVQDGVKRN